LKYTTSSFIKAAVATHGLIYDYSKVSYINSVTKVIITCPIHGDFLKNPSTHLSGTGCTKCGNMKKGQYPKLKTLTQFKSDVLKKRNDIIFLPISHYSGVNEEITVSCVEHGEFTISAGKLLKLKNPCIECAKIYQSNIHKKIDTKNWIERVSLVHKYKYTYNYAKYTLADASIIITCPKHGNFEQFASNHLSGQGCPKCGHELRSSKIRTSRDEFIVRANKIHNSKFKYGNVTSYANKKIEIICPIHGLFLQNGNSHLRGCSCPYCAKDLVSIKNKSTTEEFVSKANKLHNDKYSYTKTKYTRSTEKVIITCPTHGDFVQRASHHLDGSGCSQCSSRGFSSTSPGLLYYLQVTSNTGEVVYKIGITNRSVEERFNLTDLAHITILFYKKFPKGSTANDYETAIKRKFHKYKYEGPDILSSGNSELFTLNFLEYVLEITSPKS